MGTGFPPEPVLGPAKGRTRVRSPLRRAKEGRVRSCASKNSSRLPWRRHQIAQFLRPQPRRRETYAAAFPAVSYDLSGDGFHAGKRQRDLIADCEMIGGSDARAAFT